MQPPTPHDALVKGIFGHPEHAAGELRHLLPGALSARIDWSTLRLESGTFVDEALRGRHSDLLFSARCDGAILLVYLLFEHQSTDDPLMAFRLLVYMVRIWEHVVRARPDTSRLPAIVPLVLHHSEQGWSSPTSFEQLLAVDADTLALLLPHIPRFRFLLDDISAESDESLRARAMTALGRLALFALRHAREPWRMVEELVRWLDLIREVRAAPGGREALGLIWRHLLVTSNPKEPEALVKHLIAVVGEGGKEELMSIADWYMEQGEQRGQKKALLQQLRARFGALPEGVEARVHGASAEQLGRWLDRVLTAATLDDVLDAAS